MPRARSIVEEDEARIGAGDLDAAADSFRRAIDALDAADSFDTGRRAHAASVRAQCGAAAKDDVPPDPDHDNPEPRALASLAKAQGLTRAEASVLGALALVASTSSHEEFRFAGETWIFNLATKGLSPDQTYVYEIALSNGSVIDFRFGLR